MSKLIAQKRTEVKGSWTESEVFRWTAEVCLDGLEIFGPPMHYCRWELDSIGTWFQ